MPPRRIQADGGGGRWGVCGDTRQAASTVPQRQQGRGRVRGGICGFAGNSGGWRSVRLVWSLVAA